MLQAPGLQAIRDAWEVDDRDKAEELQEEYQKGGLVDPNLKQLLKDVCLHGFDMKHSSEEKTGFDPYWHPH